MQAHAMSQSQSESDPSHEDTDKDEDIHPAGTQNILNSTPLDHPMYQKKAV